MSDVSSLRDTIVPKSDRVNADDFLAGAETVVITGVRRGDADTPVAIELQGRKPYYPCKSMRRVLIAAWGDDGRTWAGRSLTLYTDPEVKFGGVKVGGIRISHMSNIDAPLLLSLTATKGKRAPYRVEPLRVAMYPEDKFNAALPAMLAAISGGKMTPQQVIEHCRKTGELTQDQIAKITPQQQNEEDVF